MHSPKQDHINWVFDFYTIALKRNLTSYMRYGQQKYDFAEGVMSFISPGQVLNFMAHNKSSNPTGYILHIHPDFLWNTLLAKTINQYKFFNYSVNEALFLSDQEESVITGILKNIEKEYHANIDKFSQQIIISQIELLLNYAQRFYERQFITRRITNHKVLAQLEVVLDKYFERDMFNRGLPTVQYVSDELHISPSYLSSLLKNLTGQSTQQHIQNKLIEKAKTELSTTNLSISEIAYNLGFEHSQSFSKLFKNKTQQTPTEFRQSFN